MAVRLSIAFGTSAESWLTQQTQYDLWHAEQRRKKLRVRKLALSASTSKLPSVVLGLLSHSKAAEPRLST
jgi:plasmid maintenance system antidote protein VapI